MAQFTPGELAVMCILWKHGELKPSEVQQRFPEPIKNPALRRKSKFGGYLGVPTHGVYAPFHLLKLRRTNAARSMRILPPSLATHINSPPACKSQNSASGMQCMAHSTCAKGTKGSARS